MTAKIIFLLALAAVVVKSQESNNICDCDTEEKHKEKDLLWDLLNKFAAKLDGADVSDDESKIYASLPGMISPILRCECMENTRKKRKIFPEPAESVEVETLGEDMEQREKKSVQIYDRRCPAGFARVGIYCYDLNELE